MGGRSAGRRLVRLGQTGDSCDQEIRIGGFDRFGPEICLAETGCPGGGANLRGK
jgi:hypothetical protein